MVPETWTEAWRVSRSDFRTALWITQCQTAWLATMLEPRSDARNVSGFVWIWYPYLSLLKLSWLGGSSGYTVYIGIPRCRTYLPQDFRYSNSCAETSRISAHRKCVRQPSEPASRVPKQLTALFGFFRDGNPFNEHGNPIEQFIERWLLPLSGRTNCSIRCAVHKLSFTHLLAHWTAAVVDGFAFQVWLMQLPGPNMSAIFSACILQHNSQDQERFRSRAVTRHKTNSSAFEAVSSPWNAVSARMAEPKQTASERFMRLMFPNANPKSQVCL